MVVLAIAILIIMLVYVAYMYDTIFDDHNIEIDELEMRSIILKDKIHLTKKRFVYLESVNR